MKNHNAATSEGRPIRICATTPGIATDTPPAAAWTPERLKIENDRRNAALASNYDPILGIGCCGERIELLMSAKSRTITLPDATKKRGNATQASSESHKKPAKGPTAVMVPATMLADADFKPRMSWAEHAQCRIRHDFEFWCAECVTIKDKITSRNINFTLNAPQRRVLRELEAMRIARQPIRMIMLKARQWGGSTLVQIYMAWMQIVHHKRWNSLICGHLKDTSATIKGMYARLLTNYPDSYTGGTPMRFRSFEHSRNVSEITTRECIVSIGSAESQEAIRGFDIAMAHLTEVAFWRNTPQKSPDNLIRAVGGSVALVADSVIVLESTANGVGNFFHTEWLRSKAGLSDKVAVFVPWYEIEIYRRPVDDQAALWAQLDDYERNLWENCGVTLEMLNWYHSKRREYSSHALMKAEYPSNDVEAFALSGRMVFDASLLDVLRRDCHSPIATGDIHGDAVSGTECLRNLHFTHAENGMLKVWQMPDAVCLSRNRYLVSVDVGGTSDKADFSVIAVVDRHSPCGKPEVVAQWRGHLDHDLMAWKAAQIAMWYNHALLVIESNTLETSASSDGATDGRMAKEYILSQIGRAYPNLYRRANRRPGFNTNVSTKTLGVYELMRYVRDSLYVEHDSEAVDEMSWFEMKNGGGYGAIAGRHDDIVMTRAIAFLTMHCTAQGGTTKEKLPPASRESVTGKQWI